MKIYLAARYSRHEEMAGVAKKLAKAGHDVTSRWIHGNHELRDKGQENEERARLAMEDLEDITKAECMISFTEDPNDLPKGKRPSKGGRHVEFGVATILGMRSIVIGPQEHVFHYLPDVEVYPDFDSFLKVLKKEKF